MLLIVNSLTYSVSRYVLDGLTNNLITIILYYNNYYMIGIWNVYVKVLKKSRF